MNRLGDLHQPRYLHTHCAKCDATITILAAAAKIGGMIRCWQCNTPARIWQLIGRENRESGPLDTRIGGTEAA